MSEIPTIEEHFERLLANMMLEVEREERRKAEEGRDEPSS